MLKGMGACKPGWFARTCNFQTVANLLRLRREERRGERLPPKGISAPLAG
jgi:hypothetical protein